MATRSVGRKLLVLLGIVAGAVVLLVAALLVLVNSGVATKRVVDLVLPKVSASLGREVTLRDAELKLFPAPRVTLAGVTVAGRAGEPPLVEAESLDVAVRLWPLVRSLGKDIVVEAVTLVRPSLNLVKAKDGTWNFEGLGGGAGTAPPKPAPPAPAPSEPAPSEPGEAPRVAVDLVRVEGAAIRVIDRSLGKDDPGIALTRLDLEARGVGPGLPLDARLAAALADTRQNLHAQLSVARLPAGVPARPEDWPAVQGSLQLAALAIDRIRALLPGEIGAIVRGGTTSVDAKLTTREGTYRVEGSGELKDVRLRGQAASGRFRAAAAWSPAKPDAARLDLTDLAVRGPGMDLGGNVSVETSPMRAWFVLTGPLLDLDAVMGILPEAPAEAKAAQAKDEAAAGGDLVPASTRRQIQEAKATGTIAIARLRGGRLEASDVKARATLSRGTLVLDEMTAGVFGGRVSASGTRVALSEPVPSWKLVARLSGLDLAQGISAFSKAAPLQGKLDGTLEIDGKGTEWEKLRDGLSGLAGLSVKEGALTTADLGEQVLGSLSKGLQAIGRGGAAKKVASLGGQTTFRDLAGRFTVKDGILVTQSPLQLGSGTGKLTLGGGIGLDGRLDLRGNVLVPKKVLAQAVSGIPLPDELGVPLSLGGSLASPRVSVSADEAVAGLVKGQAKQATQRLREEAEKEGKKAVEGLLKRFGR